MIAALLLVVFLTHPVSAAWDFDSTDSVTLGDHAALTLPDADWSLCGWFKKDANTGSSTSALAGWGAINATPSANIYCREASNATAPNALTVLVEDDTGDADRITFNSSGTPCATTTWQHVCMIRSSTTVTLYLVGSSIGSGSDADFDSVDLAAAWSFGEAGGTSFLDDGHLAEWAKWDRALSTAEMVTLQKYDPACVPGFSWYVPMVREYQELRASLTVTNTTTTTSDHPPLIRCD